MERANKKPITQEDRELADSIIAAADPAYLHATLRNVHIRLYGISPGKKDHACDFDLFLRARACMPISSAGETCIDGAGSQARPQGWQRGLFALNPS